MHQAIPASDEWKHAPGKKNTVKWCRGKEGREHTPEIRLAYWYGRHSKCGYIRDLYPWWESAPYYKNRGDEWQCGHEKYCTTCGKIFGTIGAENCPVRKENELN